jgi:LuxR family transcriptional regulator, maltose regulon positive regulatory protein
MHFPSGRRSEMLRVSMPPTTVIPAPPGSDATWSSELVPRPRLVDRLLGAANVPLVLVVAPAGFGKSALLSEWADRDPRPFTWVAADRIPPPDVGTPTVMVVDGADVAPGTLAALVDRMPPGSQLALASRTEPPLPVGRLRAHRRLLEIRSGDLAMTRSEAVGLLRLAGLDLDSAQATALVERTEGWPACLYLAALALRDEPDAATALAAFGGHDRLVSEYLREEVLSQLTPDRHQFLMLSSVLDTLSGPVCDFVLERRDSAGVLSELARSNLLLVPVDRTDERYRHHALLAGALAAELRRLEPGRGRALHRRASAWHSDHDDPDRAIDHAVAAADVHRAGDLLWRHVPRYVPRGRGARVERWLGAFSEDEVAGEPSLALVAATLALTAGDGNRLRHWTSAAASGLGRAQRGERESRLQDGLAVIRASICADGLGTMRDEAMRAYGREADDSPWRAACCLLEGVARQLTGEPELGRAALEEGARRGAVVAPTVHTLCLAQLALLALEEGDDDSAEALAGRAIAQVERFGIRHYPTQASVFAAAAAVRAQAGRVEEAGRDLRHSQRLLAALTDFVPWYDAEVRLALARAAVRLGDVPTARTLLAEAARFLRQVPDAVVLRRWLDEVRALADAAAGSAAGRGWSLTTAELRVLQFLPGHLSFPEIAERLCVSPNTVKTHARALYRKLDASSRAEAVACAQRAGLLGQPATT